VANGILDFAEQVYQLKVQSEREKLDAIRPNNLDGDGRDGENPITQFEG
jgi:hypothetical protein